MLQHEQAFTHSIVSYHSKGVYGWAGWMRVKTVIHYQIMLHAK